MKKKYVWLSAGVLAVIGGFLAVLILLRDHITVENFQKIQPGMTEKEVESVLGQSADHQYHPWNVVPFMAVDSEKIPEWEKAWEGQHGMIIIHVDAQGKVCKRGFFPEEKAGKGLFARLRQWIGW